MNRSNIYLEKEISFFILTLFKIAVVITRKNILFTVLLFLPILSLGQKYPVKIVNTTSGLASNCINDVIRSSTDMVWLATDYGVSAYNGNTVTNYTVSKGLAHNNCTDLIEDGNKTIWIATYGGGVSYIKNGSIQVVDKRHGLVNNSCRKLFIHNSLIYVGTQKGISIIDSKTKKIISEDLYEEKYQIMDFFSFKNEVFVITFKNGIFKLGEKKLELVNKVPVLFCSYINGDFIYLGLDGNLEINKSVRRYKVEDLIQGGTTFESFGQSVIWDMVRVGDDLFLAGWGVNFDSGGLFVSNDLDFSRCSDFEIESKNIKSLFFDKTTNLLYVGSADAGLYILDLVKPISKEKIKDFANQQPLRNSFALLNDSEEVFLGSLSLKPNDFLEYLERYKLTVEGKLQLKNTRALRDFSLDDMDYRSVFKIKNTQITDSHFYVNTSLGLFKLQLTGKVKIDEYFPISALSFHVNSESEIFFQRPYSNFFKISLFTSGNTYYSYPLDLNNPKDAFSIFSLENHVFAISRFSGIYKQKDSLFTSLNSSNGLMEKEFVLAKKVSTSQALLVNTSGSIFELSNKTKRLNEILNINNLIGTVSKDVDRKDSLLFVLTDLGLNTININTGKRKFIDGEHGLDVSSIERIEIINDKICLISSKEVFGVHITFLMKHHHCGSVKLGSVLVQNKKTVSYNNILNLEPSENDLSINLETVGVKYPKKLFYRFKIIGKDSIQWTEWNQLSDNPSIKLPYFPAGNYRVKLETSNLFTGNSHLYSLLNINKRLAFYRSPWFYSTLLVLFLVVFYSLIKRKYKRKYKRQKERSFLEKRLEEAKLEALTSQMSPHFIFNSLNVIQGFIFDDKKDESIEYINHFSTLIRKTLDYSSKKAILCSEELEYLDLYVKIQNLRFGERIKYTVYLDEKIDVDDLELPSLLIQPVIENCFEHAFTDQITEPKIDLRIDLVGAFIIISIEDNGIGISRENLTVSKAIPLTLNRLNLLDPQNKLEVISLTEGTEVKLFIKQDYL